MNFNFENDNDNIENEQIKKNEKKKFNILDLYRNKRYYSIINLAFYSIIFIILIVMVRVSPNNDSNNNINGQNSIVSESKFQGYDNIKNKNFNFIYTLELDKTKNILKGKQYNDKILFIDNKDNHEYYSEGNIILEKDNKNYILSKYKTDYFNYLDVDLIEKLLLVSKFDDEEYIITIKDFLQIIGDEINVEDTSLEVAVDITKSNNIITKIEFDLSDYALLKGFNYNNLILTLEYSDFKLVEEFEIE